jgi:sigma-E factor negative regulatory protein RseA
MNKMNNQELLSALADGQLSGTELAEGLRVLGEDAEAVSAWRAWHLIGDVMRSPELAAGTPTDRFMSRLSQRLAAEAAPLPLAVESAITAAEPANDAVFRWKLVAGLASVAAVVAVGWTLLSSQGMAPAGAQLAAAPATQGGVMIRDAQLDELLAAHRQLGDTTALQMPARFLRNATFEGPAR